MLYASGALAARSGAVEVGARVDHGDRGRGSRTEDGIGDTVQARRRVLPLRHGSGGLGEERGLRCGPAQHLPLDPGDPGEQGDRGREGTRIARRPDDGGAERRETPEDEAGMRRSAAESAAGLR